MRLGDVARRRGELAAVLGGDQRDESARHLGEHVELLRLALDAAGPESISARSVRSRRFPPSSTTWLRLSVLSRPSVPCRVPPPAKFSRLDRQLRIGPQPCLSDARFGRLSVNRPPPGRDCGRSRSQWRPRASVCLSVPPLGSGERNSAAAAKGRDVNRRSYQTNDAGAQPITGAQENERMIASQGKDRRGQRRPHNRQETLGGLDGWRPQWRKNSVWNGADDGGRGFAREINSRCHRPYKQHWRRRQDISRHPCGLPDFLGQCLAIEAHVHIVMIRCRIRRMMGTRYRRHARSWAARSPPRRGTDADARRWPARRSSPAPAVRSRIVMERERIIPTQYRPTIPLYSTPHAELNENLICASAEQT